MSLRATNRSETISIPVLVVIASPSLGFQTERSFLVVIASPSLGFQAENGLLVVIASPSLGFQAEKSFLVVIASPLSLSLRAPGGAKQSKLDCFDQPPKTGSLAMTKCKQRYEILQINEKF